MNLNRLFLSVFGMGLATVFFVNALEYPEAAAQMPLIYSVVVALLSLAMLVSEMASLRSRKAGAGNTEVAEPTEAEEPRPSHRYGAVAIVFALAIAYIVSISTLGYLLATVAFMGLALLVIRTVSVTFAVVGTLVLTAIVCLVFIQFLGLPVPLLPSLS